MLQRIEPRLVVVELPVRLVSVLHQQSERPVHPGEPRLQRALTPANKAVRAAVSVASPS
ncbi:hypothetical protein ACIBCM_32875 [Streptomyces sp. NPDC051018]|uniref:hypothetical protein n=1 Tax=Streptomyces sp. NPDC051018 TaxID=3365639 RepID=UPI00379B71CB